MSEGGQEAPGHRGGRGRPCEAPSAHRRPGYPLSGCVPAEPDSVSPGGGNSNQKATREQDARPAWRGHEGPAPTGVPLNPGGPVLLADVGPFYAPITKWCLFSGLGRLGGRE